MSVQSLTRAFAILRLIADHPEGIGVTTLAENLDLHKSTVSRLLRTLEAEKAVERLPKYGGYRLGAALLNLALKSSPQQGLESIARPFLQELTDVTSESASLEVQDGWFIHYLAQVQSGHAIRVDDWVGRRHPLHIVTSGVLFMSTWTDRALQRYFARDLEQPTTNCITTLAAMKKAIATANASGFAHSVDAFADGLTGLSAPIYDVEDKIVATINIAAPTFRFPAPGQLNAVANRLMAATESISEQLAWSEQRQKRP